MEPFNLEINTMSISPSLSDQTNRTTSANVENVSPINGQHHTVDNSLKQSDQLESDMNENGTFLQPSTPSKHHIYMNSNKENLKNCFLEEKMETTLDEPMDIDTSQLMPQTPLNNRIMASRRNDEQLNEDDCKPAQKPPISGAKIVKPIRPIGAKIVKPYVPPVADFNEDEFANIDPFKTKPKIGFDSSISPGTMNRTPPPQQQQTDDYCTTPTQEENHDENIQQNDEWETHKKRSSTSGRKCFNKLNDEQSKTCQQETSPPTKQTSSVVSSNNDLSSSVSCSPPPEQQINPLLVLSATSTSSFSSSNTNSTSSISNNKLNDEMNFQTPKHQIYTNSIEINVHNDLKEDDLISEEKLLNLKKSQFIETSNRNGETPDVDNLIDFNKLHDLDDASDKIDETNDFKTEDNLNAVESVVFDSIFSNDNDFQSFLDLLEKKEVSSIKKSPKYSEFARKSLYLQFDPIAQLSKSLSPDKVKRLSLIVDKQAAIKNFLSGIAEEENESELNNSGNKITTTTTTITKLVDLEHIASDSNAPEKNETICLNNEMENLETNNHVEADKFELDPRFVQNEVDVQDIHETNEIDNVKLSTSQNVSPKPNNTILDLDQLQLSDTKLSHQILETGLTKRKSLVDDSLLDDIQIFTKNSASIKAANPTRSISKTNSIEETTTSHSPSITSSSDDAALIAKLINENKALKEREKANLAQMQSLEDENDKFKTVAIEFEGIFRNLIKDKEESEAKLKNEIIELTKERGHLQEDVIGVERAFDDLHRRFEKLKTKVEEFKKNEESLQKAIETYKQQLDKEKNKYSTLKKHAEEKLEHANSEIDKLRKTTSIELQTLKAELRKAEIKISSLELSVHQKDQENTQLTNLLEDLLSKVKPNN